MCRLDPQKIFQKPVKSQESFFVVFAHLGHILFLKSIFHLFLDFIQARFSLRIFCSMQCMTMIRCALHSPGSRQPLGNFRCVVWTHGKIFRGLQSHCRHVLSTLATLDKSIFEVNFSSIFRFYSPQVFIAYFLFYATYDHDSMCVALPWFGATSRILRMCHLDTQKIFQKTVKSLQTLFVNLGGNVQFRHILFLKLFFD